MTPHQEIAKTMFGAYHKKNFQNWNKTLELILERGAVIGFWDHFEGDQMKQTAVVDIVDFDEGMVYAHSLKDGEIEHYDVKIEDTYYVRNSRFSL